MVVRRLRAAALLWHATAQLMIKAALAAKPPNAKKCRFTTSGRHPLSARPTVVPATGYSRRLSPCGSRTPPRASVTGRKLNSSLPWHSEDTGVHAMHRFRVGDYEVHSGGDGTSRRRQLGAPLLLHPLSLLAHAGVSDAHARRYGDLQTVQVVGI